MDPELKKSLAKVFTVMDYALGIDLFCGFTCR